MPTKMFPVVKSMHSARL